MTTNFKDNIVLQHLKATPFRLWMETDEIKGYEEIKLLKEELYIANMTRVPMKERINLQLQIQWLSTKLSMFDEFKKKHYQELALYQLSLA